MKKYVLMFVLGLVVFLIHIGVVKHGIYGDGNGYYSLAYTLFVGRSLDFRPIYNHLSHFQGSSYVFSRVFWDTKVLETGVLNCPWLIGTALSWLPAFILPLSPFSLGYELLVGVMGIFYMVGGLYFIEKTISLYYPKSLSQFVIYCLYFGSFIFYYSSLEPALSHQPSFFLISFILYIMLSTITFSYKKLLILGFCLGLLFIIRMSDLFFLGPFVLFLLATSKKFVYNKIKSLLMICFGVVIGILPQLVLQYYMYGNIFFNPYIQGGKWSFGLPSLVGIRNILFLFKGGFLTVSPLFFFSLIGLYTLAHDKHSKLFQISRIVIVTFIFYVFFIISWYMFPPAGFGNRFFIQTIPFLALGLTAFLQSKKANRFMFLLLHVVWNMSLLFYFFARM